jgi:expansin (peptidoglycan-binding protein)
MRRVTPALLAIVVAAGLPTTPAVAAVKPDTVHRGDATYYPADEAFGNCSYGRVSYLRTAALNSADYDNARMCGAYLQVTGPRGTEIVKIIDRCPECKPGDIDLNRAVFARIGDPRAGRVRVSWKLVSPNTGNKLSFRYKEGSSAHWCALQVRNHRNPVTKLELYVNRKWRVLPRTDYNYFTSNDGKGCGAQIRVTDIYGQSLTASGIALRPGKVENTKLQFREH